MFHEYAMIRRRIPYMNTIDQYIDMLGGMRFYGISTEEDESMFAKEIITAVARININAGDMAWKEIQKYHQQQQAQTMQKMKETPQKKGANLSGVKDATT